MVVQYSGKHCYLTAVRVRTCGILMFFSVLPPALCAEGEEWLVRNTTSSVKHGRCSELAWACMAANVTGSLLVIDNVTANRSSRRSSDVYAAILSAQVQPNAAKLMVDALQSRWIMNHNILQKQPKGFSRQRK